MGIEITVFTLEDYGMVYCWYRLKLWIGAHYWKIEKSRKLTESEIAIRH